MIWNIFIVTKKIALFIYLISSQEQDSFVLL